jgi:hypothetical protein
MKALVVYESTFGNTEEVAQAIARGLAEHLDVGLVEVSTAPPVITEPLDLIVVGAPTHAFSMSWPSTREGAIRVGSGHGSKAVGVREWLGHQRKGPHTELVAMFDTRVGRVSRLPRSAAKGAVKLAHKLGYATAAKPESFYVGDVTGPLLAGELDRAQAWGERLGLVGAQPR